MDAGTERQGRDVVSWPALIAWTIFVTVASFGVSWTMAAGRWPWQPAPQRQASSAPPGACIMCHQPLPPRRWFEVTKPPPLCRDAGACFERFCRRVGRDRIDD